MQFLEPLGLRHLQPAVFLPPAKLRRLHNLQQLADRGDGLTFAQLHIRLPPLVHDLLRGEMFVAYDLILLNSTPTLSLQVDSF